MFTFSDLKLNNVMISDEDQVKLIDFGTAGKVAAGILSKTYCGTPAYAAPELVHDQNNRMSF